MAREEGKLTSRPIENPIKRGVLKMATLTYGDYSLNTAEIPESSLVALASAGLAHTLGNVVASRVVSEIRKTINSEKPGDVTTEAVKAWRKANEDKIGEMSAKFQAEALKAINEGTLGVHAPRGPGASTDPLMAEMRKIAKTQITAILEAAGMKFPGKVKGIAATVTLKGTAFTGDDLIANRLNVDYEKNNRKAIEDEAKRALAARKRDAERHAAQGVDML